MTASYSALALTTAVLALTTLSSFIYVAAAFSNDFSSLPSRRQQLMLGNCHGHDFNTRVSSSTISSSSSSTALFYKDLEGGTETSEETSQPTEEFFMRSNKKRHKILHKKKQQSVSSSYTAATTPSSSTEATTTTTTTTSTTKTKKKKKKLKNKQQRSYTLHKRAKVGGPVATPEELASHVQAVFSDLKEYEQHGGSASATGDGDLEDQFDDDDDERSSSTTQHDKGVMKQNSLLLDKHPSLVLNADYQPLRMLPLSTWSWQTTVKAVLSGKAVVVDVYPDLYVRAVSLDIPVPSVIALREYAPTGKAKPAFTRRNVFLRDGYRCQYCSNLFRTTDLSLDHVMPRCLGGKLTWDNTVTCCKKCNGRKGSLLPTELDLVGMELRREPRCPSLFELAAEAGRFVPRRVHPTWEPFLDTGREMKD